jgi:uncharacterized membrane protein YhaH (DUF805 family)
LLIEVGNRHERKFAMEWYLMVWKKFAQFDGRSRRKEYWMFTLFNLLAVVLLAAIALAGIAVSQDNGPLLFIPIALYGLAALIPSIAAATRRFHDIGKSGWILFLLIVLGIIPFVGIVCGIIQLVFLCQDSVPGPNEYGPNPKFPEQGGMLYAGLPPGAIPAGYAVPPQQPVIVMPPQPPANALSSGFCSTCGAGLTDGSPFCGSCGTRI